MDAEQAAWMAIFARIATALERMADTIGGHVPAPYDDPEELAYPPNPVCRAGVSPCSFSAARHPPRCENTCIHTESRSETKP
jgi:hypothetical protein